MTDVNDLDLAPPDEIDWSNYDDNASRETPPSGEYELLVAEAPVKSQTKPKEEGDKPYLLVNLPTITVEDPSYKGHKILFTKYSAKKIKDSNSSMLGNYLRGFGMPGPFRTNDEYWRAAAATFGRKFRAKVKWRGFCKVCRTEYPEATFPVVGEKRQGWIDCPKGCRDQKNLERPNRVFANLEIAKVISAVKKDG